MGASHLVKTKEKMTDERPTLITVMKSHVNALNICSSALEVLSDPE